MTAKRRLKPAEGFKTLEEEVEYWGRHGSEGSGDERARLDVDIAPEARARMISIRMPGDLLDAVRVAARDRGVPYQSLMKEWLRKALDGQRATPLPVARERPAPYGEPPEGEEPPGFVGSKSEEARERNQEELRKRLAFATSLIAPEYFQLPVAAADPVYRERVYAYELYHQLRNVWGGFPYSLCGEVDKTAHSYFENGPYSQAKPDLLVHRPGTMGDNLAVVEVKPAGVSTSRGHHDLKKLTWFCQHAGYYRGVFLVYGEWGDPRKVAKGIRDWNGDGIDFKVLECFYHRRAGGSASRLSL